jgi:hypothetical protein
MKVNRDFSDLLSEFNAERVRYLVAYVLSYYGRPRTTGALDLGVDPTRENADRVFRALEKFGAPLKDVSADDFATSGTVFQIGVAPNRVDVLTSLTALDFPNAWTRRRKTKYGKVPIAIISETDYVRNKKAVGRAQDLADAEEVERLLRARKSRKRP